MIVGQAVASIAEILMSLSGHDGSLVLLAVRNDDQNLLAKIKPGKTASAKEIYRSIWKICNEFKKRERQMICDRASVVCMYGLPTNIGSQMDEFVKPPVTAGVEPRFDDRPTAWVVRGLEPGSLARTALLDSGMYEVLGSNDLEWPCAGKWPGGEFGPPNEQ